MTSIFALFPISTCLYFALMGPLLAAQTANTDTANPHATESDMAAAKAADVCRDDVNDHRLKAVASSYG
jgi:hypothetical protein